MASISKDKDGGRRIQFVNSCKQRKAVRLGTIPLKAVNEVKAKVEVLNAAVITRSGWDRETAEWVGALDPALYDKLAKVGLVSKRQVPEQAALGPFLDGYLAKRADIKPGTMRNLRIVRNNLVLYFGENKPLPEITEGDADDWRIWLATEEVRKDGKLLKSKLDANTVRRRCGRARQLFRAALKRKVIVGNPFGDMKDVHVQANKSREYFITREEAEKVLAACPDSQWGLLFALSRYGGLRCPSEHLALQWGDVNLESGVMTVHSSKTEHYDGKESRIVPIFPELRPYIEAVFNEFETANGRPPSQTDCVITRYRETNTNLRTQLKRIMKRASVPVWPKLFQNLRSTRQTELQENFPIHVVCAWMGNSEAVAKKHYLQVTQEHIDRALLTVEQKIVEPRACAREPAAQNPAQQPSASVCNGMQPDTNPSRNALCIAETMTPTGLEPVLPA